MTAAGPRPVITPRGLLEPIFPEKAGQPGALMRHVLPRRVHLQAVGEYPWRVVRSLDGPVWRQRGVRAGRHDPEQMRRRRLRLPGV